MVNEDILKRINRGRLLGLKYSEVKNLLIKKGYDSEQINEAILIHFKSANKYSIPKQMMHTISKKSRRLVKRISEVKLPDVSKVKIKLPKVKIPKIKIKSKKKRPIKRRYKKPVKKARKKQAIKRVVIKDPSKYFYFCNDKKAKNMTQFIAIVKKLNDDEFKHHVNKDRNDFYNWINDVVGDKGLASKLKNKINKDKVLAVLKR